MIDLRSDTVTLPTPAMRQAMAEAEVGDDVYGEDPTVNRLEETAAGLTGKDAALLVPSGTMANQIAIAVHSTPGSEVICEGRAHVVEVELASMAVISGCMPRPVVTPDGILTADLIEGTLRPVSPGETRAGLILVENTHNRASGAVTPVNELRQITRLAASREIPLHMDGARIFNAAAACSTEAHQLAEGFDSMMFCLSKGLSAPIGSLLCGSAPFIAEARRWRKRLGGGMRQAGVIAAAGVVALDTMRERLVEDHENAFRLAAGLGSIDRIVLEVPDPITNIVYVRVEGARWTNATLVEALRKEGVLCNPVGNDRIRFVTHYGITSEDIDRALAVLPRAVAALPRPS